jgi:hypothetical protein
VNRRLEGFCATEFGANVIEPELSKDLTLKVMPPLAGFHECHATIRAQNRDRNARKTRSGPDVSE